MIVGHYGGCNTGDEAMLAGLLGAVAPELRRRTTVVVKDELIERSYLKMGVKLVPAGFGPVIRALLNSDALVIGGGTHFHDDYTLTRYLRHFRYMLRFVSLAMLAKLMGRKVAWLGMGFGPFYRTPTRWITRLGLKFCDRVSVRDAKSLDEIAPWLPPGKLDLTFDLAALLLRSSCGALPPPSKEEFRCRVLGVSATSVLHCKSGGREVDSVVWRSLADALIRTLDENPGLRVKIIIFRGGDREDDQAVSQNLYTAISSARPGRVELIPFQPEPAAMLQKISECDAFVATRYHSGVLAYLASCRMLFLAYHRKVQDLAQEIGLPEEACLSVAEAVDEERLAGALRDMVHGNKAYRAPLPLGDATARAALSVQSLEELD